MRELRLLGYEGGTRQVHKWLQTRRTKPARNTPRRWRVPDPETAYRPTGPAETHLPGPKALAWIMAMLKAKRTATEAAILAQILQDEEAATMHNLVRRFAAIVRDGSVSRRSSSSGCAERLKAFEAWVADAMACGLRAAQTFAADLVGTVMPCGPR